MSSFAFETPTSRGNLCVPPALHTPTEVVAIAAGISFSAEKMLRRTAVPFNLQGFPLAGCEVRGFRLRRALVPSGASAEALLDGALKVQLMSLGELRDGPLIESTSSEASDRSKLTARQGNTSCAPQEHSHSLVKTGAGASSK